MVSAQPSLQTILTNGPAANRFNIVVLSEGYQAAQLGQFLVDATNAVNAVLSHQPHQEYRRYFNAVAIRVASNQSGSDHPAYGSWRDTFFNSAYDALSDYIISIPADSQGQGKVDALLQTFTPYANRLSVLLVNDPVPGGSDGFDQTAIAATSFELPEILTHETGHVVANLGDEYDSAYPGFPDVEEPNTTRETRRAFIKWNAWISANTPVPTPPTAPYANAVGLFEGAHYHTNGWYRPKLNCAMRSQYAPFCEVCSEALVLALYQRVRPIDSFAPASTNLSLTATQALYFSVTLLQPTTHNLAVQWFTNDVAVAGATNASFTVLPQALGNGSQSVRAVVRDATALVRNDPANLLRQSVTWTLSVSIPRLLIDAPQWIAGGRFRFRVSGTAPQGVVIEGSTSFANWLPLSTNVLAGGQFWYTNGETARFPARLFRAVTHP